MFFFSLYMSKQIFKTFRKTIFFCYFFVQSGATLSPTNHRFSFFSLDFSACFEKHYNSPFVNFKVT